MKQTGNSTAGINDPGTTIIIRPHNLKELSNLYNISARTLRKWLQPFEKEIGKRVGYIYTITQVKKIFAVLGFPGAMEKED